ncbi:MAG: hypothetical protein CBB87_00560 [Micavibrio sp. TMED27]|nr:hypothetical protein [Micavibrio sp.]OUT92966.1 MAG: hypothetical protein CBB87_00560 [Micavibrio sp. TMED27]|tara:strand:+ start:2926 stop:3846 length:921 start_codon:yes stop_codon:yes gene_type:complete
MKRYFFMFVVAVVIALPIAVILMSDPKSEGHIPQSYLSTLEKKALNGDVDAMFKIGDSYANGRDGTKVDLKESIRWYKMAIEHDNTNAMNSLALIYKNEKGEYKKIEEAITLLTKAALLGNDRAAYNLGLVYIRGDNVDKNISRGVELMRSAALGGYPNAMEFLGLFYYQGDGIEKDTVKARTWLEMAISHGREEAYYGLAVILMSDPKSDLVDYYIASEYYKKAEKSGNKYSRKSFSEAAEKCVKDDDYQGFPLYSFKHCFLASYSRDPAAMLAVGISFLNGRGAIPINRGKVSVAVKWGQNCYG